MVEVSIGVPQDTKNDPIHVAQLYHPQRYAKENSKSAYLRDAAHECHYPSCNVWSMGPV